MFELTVVSTQQRFNESFVYASTENKRQNSQKKNGHFHADWYLLKKKLNYN